jgi:hypothetical protein
MDERGDLEWPATRIWAFTKPEVQVFAVGPDGIVSIGTVSGNAEEYIEKSPEGTASRGPICDLRGIGKSLDVCGMGRQVYRRVSEGK